jgi:hypothetical protein
VPDEDGIREVARELLELRPAADSVPAVVPPPPVAAVHRPSSWRGESTPQAAVGHTAEAAPTAGPTTARPAGPERRIDRGAVTERIVREAAAAGQRLVLGRGAVVTPLALDRARRLGVEIMKER